MKIPSDVAFLFTCGLHNSSLHFVGDVERPAGAQRPTLKHPNIHATAVWTFDFNEWRCTAEAPEYQTEKYSREHPDYQGRDGTECMVHWEVRA